MRTLSLVAIFAIAIGLVWFFQGIGVLPGSFMTGQPKWAVIGGVLVVVGGATLALGRRRG